MAATFPLPALASDLNCFMIVKLLLKELVEMLDGPLARTEADAPSHAAPTSVNDNRRESPPSVADLLKRTLSPLVRPTRVGQALLPRSTRVWAFPLRFGCRFEKFPRTRSFAGRDL